MDRIIYVSECEVWVVFFNRPAMCFTSSGGYALELAYVALDVQDPYMDEITRKVAI